MKLDPDSWDELKKILDALAVVAKDHRKKLVQFFQVEDREAEGPLVLDHWRILLGDKIQFELSRTLYQLRSKSFKLNGFEEKLNSLIAQSRLYVQQIADYYCGHENSYKTLEAFEPYKVDNFANNENTEIKPVEATIFANEGMALRLMGLCLANSLSDLYLRIEELYHRTFDEQAK